MIVLACAAVPALGIPAFPGAQGFGANAIGGRFGDVYHVTSLADTNTVGTLRYGLTHVTNPNGRTIVFDVGGSIVLTSNLEVKNVSKVTIAGQTAPGPGITIINNPPAQNPNSNFYKFQVTSSSGQTTSDIIVRYLTFRRGVNSTSASTDDAAGVLGAGATNNIIFDHVSASWATDENLSVTNNATNVTVQYAYNTESLNPSGHAYGSLVRPQVNSNVSFNHNLYADNMSRNPRIGNYNGSLLQFDFRNNVVYNWGFRAAYTGGASETATEFTDSNFVGNYFIAGPSTPAGSATTTGFTLQTDADPVYVRMFQSGNKIDSNKNAARDGADTGWSMFVESNAGGITTFPVDSIYGKRMPSAFAWPGLDYLDTDSADDAYGKVLAWGGGSLPWNRSDIDKRIAAQMTSSPNTGAIINAPNATEWNNLYTAPIVTVAPGTDTDADGMPNNWELSRGLNPSVDDHTAIASNGYTNLENYLHELTLIAAWNKDASANWSTWLNWSGLAPNATGAQAFFGPAITAERTITVDQPRTTGQLRFYSDNRYILAGANAITLDVISGNAAIEVISGSHTISAPVILNDATLITVTPAASTLTISNLQPTTAPLTKAGAGTLAVKSLRTGPLTLSSGIVRVNLNGSDAGVSYVSSLSLASGAVLDLNDNDLVINSATFTTIQNLVFTGYSGSPDPSRTGIISTTGQSAGNTILALFDNALVGASDWPLGSGNTISPNAIVGKYTYFGDANIDGAVTSDDYAILDSNLDTTPAPGIAGLSGDANMDGAVTADDYAILDSSLGAGAGNPLSPVPEPGSVAALVIFAGGAILRRRRG